MGFALGGFEPAVFCHAIMANPIGACALKKPGDAGLFRVLSIQA
jgi:hypothetical protein